MTDTLKWLKDRADIQDVVHRYPTGIDTRDWKLFRSIFADQLVMDFSSYSGGPVQHLSGDEWVAQCEALHPGFDATQHVLSNFVIDLAGDRATVTVYMKAEHFIANTEGENYHTLGGYYVHQLERGADGWKIHATTLNVTWSRGNRDVYRLAMERVAQRKKEAK